MACLFAGDCRQGVVSCRSAPSHGDGRCVWVGTGWGVRGEMMCYMGVQATCCVACSLATCWVPSLQGGLGSHGGRPADVCVAALYARNLPLAPFRPFWGVGSECACTQDSSANGKIVGCLVSTHISGGHTWAGLTYSLEGGGIRQHWQATPKNTHHLSPLYHQGGLHTHALEQHTLFPSLGRGYKS